MGSLKKRPFPFSVTRQIAALEVHQAQEWEWETRPRHELGMQRKAEQMRVGMRQEVPHGEAAEPLIGQQVRPVDTHVHEPQRGVGQGLRPRPAGERGARHDAGQPWG